MEHLTKKQKMDEEPPKIENQTFDLKELYNQQVQITANLYTVLASFNQRIIDLEKK
jgi:hypothetical protein